DDALLNRLGEIPGGVGGGAAGAGVQGFQGVHGRGEGTCHRGGSRADRREGPQAVTPVGGPDPPARGLYLCWGDGELGAWGGHGGVVLRTYWRVGVKLVFPDAQDFLTFDEDVFALVPLFEEAGDLAAVGVVLDPERAGRVRLGEFGVMDVARPVGTGEPFLAAGAGCVEPGLVVSADEV